MSRIEGHFSRPHPGLDPSRNVSKTLFKRTLTPGFPGACYWFCSKLYRSDAHRPFHRGQYAAHKRFENSGLQAAIYQL